MKYVLTEQGRKLSESFIKDCEAKRKEILDAGLDTADETDIPTVEDVECDINFIDLDSDNNYYNGWGVTDNYNADNILYLEYGIDFVNNN